MHKITVVSPLMLLVFALFIFEVIVRFPVIYFLLESNSLDFDRVYYYFGEYNPSSVMFVGMGVTCLGFLAFFFAFFFVNKRILNVGAHCDLGIQGEPSGFLYLYLFVFLWVNVLCLSSVGFDTILSSFSAKRDLGDGYGGYLLLKISLALHIFGVAYLYGYFASGSRSSLFCFFIVTMFFLFTALVFSQRLIVMVYFFELFYIFHLFRKVNARPLFFMVGVAALFLFFTTVLRGGRAFNFVEGGALFWEKILGSRYFFDFTHHGLIYIWADEEVVNHNLMIGSLFNYLGISEGLNNKEFGYLAASSIFPNMSPGGLTTGGVLDSILTFYPAGGFIFLFFVGIGFFVLEKSVFLGRKWVILKVVILGKILIFFNSSIDSFLYSVTIEFLVLILVSALVVRKAGVSTSFSRN